MWCAHIIHAACACILMTSLTLYWINSVSLSLSTHWKWHLINSFMCSTFFAFCHLSKKKNSVYRFGLTNVSVFILFCFSPTPVTHRSKSVCVCSVQFECCNTSLAVMYKKHFRITQKNISASYLSSIAVNHWKDSCDCVGVLLKMLVHHGGMMIWCSSAS